METVRQTLGLSGSVNPVDQAAASFQVSGTVSHVYVTQGQQVTAGQTLASLDPTTLEQDVSAAESTLSAAQAKLVEDESGQSSSTSSPSGTTAALTSAVFDTATAAAVASTSTPTSTPSSPAPPAGSGGGTSLQQAQQAVVTAQQTADADSAEAATALAQAQQTCAGSGGGTTTPSSTTTTTTTTTTSSTTTTTTPGNTAACVNALDAALSAQQQVAADQKAVAAAEANLAKLLTSSSSGSGLSSGGSSNGGGSSPGGSGGSGATRSGGTASGGTATHSGASSAAPAGTTTDSAEQLASDQAAIDSAQASLILAEQSLTDAKLLSPLAGTVASVGLTVGESVSAGSTSEAITIVDAGSYEATASLTTAQAEQVHVGDTSLVAVDGTTGTLVGTVARVGPVDTGNSTYSYPLIVALPVGSHGVAAGSTAQIQVVLHQVAHTLAVPTSAVNTIASGRSYVIVLESGQVARRRVSVGVVGGIYTQVTSGIGSGATVVLADLSQPVPASNTTSLFRGFGRGGLVGGGFGGGGLRAFRVGSLGG
jgi:multidrug efflux pump subunit AcrA (membrane-fusion protein)